MTKPASHMLAGRMALALLAPALLLLMLESLVRLFGIGLPTTFLLRSDRNGASVWIDNQVFGYRFFSPDATRTPPPMVVPAHKSPGERRIVVLGESAAMGEPEPAFGPAHMLEVLLNDTETTSQVRVINAAMTAINSHVITEIAHSLPALRPDVVVLYIGNNEVVGPLGPGTVFLPFEGSPMLARLRVLATRWQLAGLIRHAWWRASGGEARAGAWEGMAMFEGRGVKPDDPRLTSVHRNFEKNLQRIIAQAQRAGARVLLCTVAVNLADQAPLDGHPMPTSATLKDYKVLRDQDTQRFRADSAINAIIRRVAAERADVTLIDVEQAFEKTDPPGRNFFVDHVHFTPAGAYALARLWHDALAASHEITEPASLTKVLQRLGWTSLAALDQAELMLERYARPPFRNAVDFKSQMMYWTTIRHRALEELATFGPDEVLAQLQQTYRVHPDDPYLAQLAFHAALKADDVAIAGEWLSRLEPVWSHRIDVRGWRVTIDALKGHTGQTWATLTANAPPLGDLPVDALVGASATALRADRREAALTLMQTAVDHYPRRLRLNVLLANRLLQNGRPEESEQLLRTLYIREPDNAYVREELAGLLLLRRRPDEAADLLVSGASAEKYAHLLLAQGQHDNAVKHLRKHLVINPDDGNAWHMLTTILQQTGRENEVRDAREGWRRAEPWRVDIWIDPAHQRERTEP